MAKKEKKETQENENFSSWPESVFAVQEELHKKILEPRWLNQPKVLGVQLIQLQISD